MTAEPRRVDGGEQRGLVEVGQVTDLIQGRATLPPEPQMSREIARYRAMTARRYARSTRHAIQVDFLAYLPEIRRERQAGARRNGASRAPLADPPKPWILRPASTPSLRGAAVR